MLREGFQHGFPPDQWEAAKAEARKIMIDRASNGRTIPYSDLVSRIHVIRLEAHDPRLAHFLGEIGSEEDEAGRGILTAVVVHKTGEMKPGPGFFKLASERGRNVSNIDKCWIEELKLLESYWKAAPPPSADPLDLEQLPIVIPEYPGSHPFSRGQNPTFYTPGQLRDTAEGATNRTQFFEKVLLGIHWTIGRPVPYAFKTKDGNTRSLDAGCLKFLVNRRERQIEFVIRPDGKIAAIRPLAALLTRYAAVRDRLVADVGGIPPLELPFDINAPVDERRKIESEAVMREGGDAFRRALLDVWGNRCAITKTSVGLVIEAAHIYPYLGPKTNDIRNGLLLRSDIHKLFDAFLITIEPQGDDLIVRVSGALAGTSYERLSGKRLLLVPPQSRPDAKVVQYHFDKFRDAEKGRF